MRIAELPQNDLTDRLRRGGLRFRTGPFLCHLVSPSKLVAEALRTSYGRFPLVEQDDFADFHVQLVPPVGLRRFFRPQVLFMLDGHVAFLPYPRHLAVAILEWGLNWCISDFSNQYLISHAAVLERDGRAVMIAGMSGSGKSTLCAALALRGWRLLSDELAMMRPEDGMLVGTARPVCLKNESIDVIRRFEPTARLSPEWPGTIKGTVAHLRPPDASVDRMDEPARPAWLVFVKYNAEVTVRSRPLPRGSAMMRLADFSFNYQTLGRQGFDAMSGAIDRCHCYDFQYGDLDAAVERFSELPIEEPTEAMVP